MQRSTHLVILSVVVLWLGLACAPKQPGAKQGSQPVASMQPMAPIAGAGTISLAVLPWMVRGDHEDKNVAAAYAQEALETALGGTPFVPLHSVYALSRYPVTRIDKHKNPSLRRVWRGKGPGPNKEVVFHLGQELGVEAMILYDLDILTGTDYLRVYLVDMPRRQLYQAEAESYEFAESGYSMLLALTRQVLAEYQRHRAP